MTVSNAELKTWKSCWESSNSFQDFRHWHCRRYSCCCRCCHTCCAMLLSVICSDSFSFECIECCCHCLHRMLLLEEVHRVNTNWQQRLEAFQPERCVSIDPFSVVLAFFFVALFFCQLAAAAVAAAMFRLLIGLWERDRICCSRNVGLIDCDFVILSYSS